MVDSLPPLGFIEKYTIKFLVSSLIVCALLPEPGVFVPLEAVRAPAVSLVVPEVQLASELPVQDEVVLVSPLLLSLFSREPLFLFFVALTR